MKRLPSFAIFQPATVQEASEMLASRNGAASLYAGGTELLLAMKEGVLRYDTLIDVKTIPDLDELRVEGNELQIGAAVTHWQIEHSSLVRESVPALAVLERRVANPRVRATGTLVGNLCFAEPHSDPATLLLCLDARVVIAGARGERVVRLGEFLVGAYETSRDPDELVTNVFVPVPPPAWRIAYEKFGIHERPTLGLAVVLETDGHAETILATHVAVGCVGPTPRRSPSAERELIGDVGDLGDRLGRAADALAEDADLIDDAEGSVAYKRQLIKTFLGRAIRAALGNRLPPGADESPAAATRLNGFSAR
jgi:carbon-monoxide dehydrogenase medium subunit